MLVVARHARAHLTSAAGGSHGGHVVKVGGLERHPRADPLVWVVGQQRGQQLVTPGAEVMGEHRVGGGGGLPLGEHRLVVRQRGDPRPNRLCGGAQNPKYPENTLNSYLD